MIDIETQRWLCLATLNAALAAGCGQQPGSSAGAGEPSASGGQAQDGDSVNVDGSVSAGGSLPGSGGANALDDAGVEAPVPGPAGGGSAGAQSGSAGSLLASPCNTDAQCDPTLGVCVTVASGAWGQTGPGGGYCSARCEVPGVGAADSCATLEAGAQCLPVGPAAQGYCILGCQRGGAPEAKCRGRSDLSCDVQDLDTGLGICAPSCGANSDCPAGSACSFITGFCEPAPTDANLGQACNPGLTLGGPCPGRCFAVSDQAGYCFGYCTVGAEVACGSAEAPRDFACAFSADGTRDDVGNLLSGAGDLGLCVPTCDGSAECVAGAVCLALSPENQTLVGHFGVCDVGP